MLHPTDCDSTHTGGGEAEDGRVQPRKCLQAAQLLKEDLMRSSGGHAVLTQVNASCWVRGIAVQEWTQMDQV